MYHTFVIIYVRNLILVIFPLPNALKLSVVVWVVVVVVVVTWVT